MPTINSMFAKQEKYQPDSTRLKELTKAVGYFVAKDMMMPLNVMHGKGFCHLVEKLEPRFNIPSRKTLTEKIIPTMYIDLKQSLIFLSIKRASYVALTTDCWTSRTNASYIGLTIHFLTPDWQLEHFVLENKELPINHTADNLAEALGECLSDWNIDETQVSCTSIDNAANIVKALKDVLGWSYLNCFGHTLNLAVSAGLTVHRIHQVVVRCSRIVSFFRKSSKAMYCLKEKQSALGLPTRALVQDVVTRWNSTFSMIERVCEQQAAICASLVEQKRLDLMPDDTDISIAESILEVLKPFKHISDTMCAEKYTTTSSIKPLLHHLSNTVLIVKDSDLGAVKEMKKTMKHNLQTHYDSPEVDRLLSIACYLDI